MPDDLAGAVTAPRACDDDLKVRNALHSLILQLLKALHGEVGGVVCGDDHLAGLERRQRFSKALALVVGGEVKVEPAALADDKCLDLLHQHAARLLPLPRLDHLHGSSSVTHCFHSRPLELAPRSVVRGCVPVQQRAGLVQSLRASETAFAGAS